MIETTIPILRRDQLEHLTHLSYETLLNQFNQERIEIQKFIESYHEILKTDNSVLQKEIDFHELINLTNY